MTKTYDLIIRKGTIVNEDGIRPADVGVTDGKIAAIGDLSSASAGETMDAGGLHVLPGVIDTQVHFREPGLDAKEDLESGSRAAVLGGVTAVFEMPNTKPPTTDAAAIENKVARATNRMHCDFAFYAGATEQNASTLGELEQLPGCCGVKIFMGSSTGTLLVADDEPLEEILRHINRRAAVHSEDEHRLRERRPLAELGNVHTHPVWRDVETAVQCTKRLLRLAKAAGKRVHVLHISTAEELPLLAAYRDVASLEATPQHLTLAAPDCYERMGTRAQMNPPIRESRHRDALWTALHQGLVDVIGSDHAPHLLEEKEKAYPASPAGLPGVQTLLPVLLNHVHEGRLSLERLVDLTSRGAQRLFGLVDKGRLALGYDADLTIVDLDKTQVIEDDWIASKCGWTPFAGMDITGWPIGTIVRGRRIMWEGDLVGPSQGQPMRFYDTMAAER